MYWNHQGDILEMKLDLDNKTLSYKVNDSDFVELFPQIEISSKGYRFALGVNQNAGSKFQFL